MPALSRFISRLSNKSHAFFEAVKYPKDFKWDEKCDDALVRLIEYYKNTAIKAKGQRSIAAVPCGIKVSAFRVQEEGSMQYHVYYVSNSFMENMLQSYRENSLALVIASIKLCAYFQAHLIVVVPSAVELREYDVIFRPSTAINSRVLDNFVSESSLIMLPAM